MLVEVCAGCLDDCLVAQEAGAGRIELNTALALGGLTPGASLTRSAKQHVEIPVVVMARPRPGDFVYSASEFDLLCQEIESLLEAGADGVAFGILLPNGKIDEARVARVLDRFGKMTCDWVFHRAFDLVPDWRDGLQALVDIGLDRVLTSGQKSTALEGVETIREINSAFSGLIEILAGSGIRSENVLSFVKHSGVHQVHGSFSRLVNQQCNAIGDFGAFRQTDPEELAAVIKALACLSGN